MTGLKVKRSVVSIAVWLTAQVLVTAPVTIINARLGRPAMQGVPMAMLLSQLLELAFLLAVRYYRPAELVEKVSPYTYILAVAMGFSAFFALDLLFIPFDLADLSLDLMKTLAGTVPGALAICIAGPVSEEVIFRRIIMREIGDSLQKPWAGIIASALIFALIHGNPAQSAFALPAGIILGWTYYRTGSLLVPITIHIINNTVSFITLKLDMDPVESLSDPVALITLAVCLAVTALTTVLLAREHRREHK